ncbi:(d)CMP kinase [bacterium]|nr:(d)CMP kinase [bacterium]
MEPVITIDGPSASGKSSVSRDLAKKLEWNWVSTGAFYRGLAYAANQEKVDSSDEKALAALATSDVWRVELHPEKTLVFYKDQDVSPEIFSEGVGEKASQISQLGLVRKALLEAQRSLPAKTTAGLVAEGRDCGSIVFPEALLKVYLTANPELRAKRRAIEQGLDPEKTQASQSQRDSQDSHRKAAPLTIPEGARVLDTTNMTLEEVVDKVYEWSLKALS